MAYNKQDERVTVKCEKILNESASGLAIQIVVEDAEEAIWLPLSQVHEVCRNAQPPYVVVTPFIAKQKGLLP